MSLDQSGLLYMYERLPIWIVVSVFWKALLIPLSPISLYVWDLSNLFLEFLAGRLDRSIRDKLNKLFNDIASAICRTIRVLLKLPVQLSLMASFILVCGGKQLWIYFMTCVLLETSTCVGVSVWCLIRVSALLAVLLYWVFNLD